MGHENVVLESKHLTSLSIEIFSQFHLLIIFDWWGLKDIITRGVIEASPLYSIFELKLS